MELFHTCTAVVELGHNAPWEHQHTLGLNIIDANQLGEIEIASYLCRI
jgi:hypothetical protein